MRSYCRRQHAVGANRRGRAKCARTPPTLALAGANATQWRAFGVLSSGLSGTRCFQRNIRAWCSVKPINPKGDRMYSPKLGLAVYISSDHSAYISKAARAPWKQPANTRAPARATNTQEQTRRPPLSPTHIPTRRAAQRCILNNARVDSALLTLALQRLYNATHHSLPSVPPLPPPLPPHPHNQPCPQHHHAHDYIREIAFLVLCVDGRVIVQLLHVRVVSERGEVDVSLGRRALKLRGLLGMHAQTGTTLCCVGCGCVHAGCNSGGAGKGGGAPAPRPTHSQRG
jgi:hypothetical protein